MGRCLRYGRRAVWCRCSLSILSLFKSLMSRWNPRFAVSPSKDNPRFHEFYREYFDKPSGRKLLTRLPLMRSSSMTLRSCMTFGLDRMPTWSRCVPRKIKRKEKTWNDRFNVMWSKDNPHFHKAEREYFDRRKLWDLQAPERKEMDRMVRSTASKRSLEKWMQPPTRKASEPLYE